MSLPSQVDLRKLDEYRYFQVKVDTPHVHKLDQLAFEEYKCPTF